MEKSLLDIASRRILRELQADARQTTQQLAAKVGLSPSPCWRRIRELEEAGVVRRYTVVLDREALGLSILVLAHVTLARHTEGAVEAFEEAMAQAPEVVECFSTTGAADYVIKVAVRDMKQYESFLHARVFRLPGVANIQSHIVLREVKSAAALPVDPD